MTQRCETCRWFTREMELFELNVGRCYRYPEPIPCSVSHFCGEWAANPSHMVDAIGSAATDNERRELLKADAIARLRGENLDGSARRETKPTKPGPWVPGQDAVSFVFCLDRYGNVLNLRYNPSDEFHQEMLRWGNIFPGPEEAEREAWARRLNGFLRRMPGVRSFKNHGCQYTVSKIDGSWGIHKWRLVETPGVVYFATDTQAQAALDAAREAGLLDNGGKDEV